MCPAHLKALKINNFMKKFIVIAFVAFAGLINTSCSKDDYLTDSQRIVAEVKEFAKVQKVTRVNIFEEMVSDGTRYWVMTYANQNYSFTETSIVVGDVYFNANRLYHYEVNDYFYGEFGIKCLDLYFK